MQGMRTHPYGILYAQAGLPQARRSIGAVRHSKHSTALHARVVIQILGFRARLCCRDLLPRQCVAVAPAHHPIHLRGRCKH